MEICREKTAFRQLMSHPFQPTGVSEFYAAADLRTTRTLIDIFESLEMPAEMPFENVAKTTASAANLQSLGVACSNQFDEQQLTDIQFQVAPVGQPLLPYQWMQSQSLRVFTDWASHQWLSELLSADRLVTYLQPIVRIDGANQGQAFECLLRGLDVEGNIIAPNRLFAAARANNCLDELDRSARLTSIRTVVERNVDATIFINFNPCWEKYENAGVGETIQAVVASGIAPDRFVFEVVESDRISDFDLLLDVLDMFREAGCRVALDDLGTGYNSLALMTRVRPDFVKLDMQLIRNVDQDPYKSCVIKKLLELAQELELLTVGEGVETIGEWQWLKEHGANFAQGYLFGRPSAEPRRATMPSADATLTSTDTAATVDSMTSNSQTTPG